MEICTQNFVIKLLVLTDTSVIQNDYIKINYQTYRFVLYSRKKRLKAFVKTILLTSIKCSMKMCIIFIVLHYSMSLNVCLFVFYVLSSSRHHKTLHRHWLNKDHMVPPDYASKAASKNKLYYIRKFWPCSMWWWMKNKECPHLYLSPESLKSWLRKLKSLSLLS